MIDGVEAARQQLGDLRRMLEIQAGLDFLGTDVAVCVLDFGESLWVVPDTVPFDASSDWAEHMRANQGFHWARVASLPQE